MTERQTKITFAEMREMGIRGLLIYCAVYRCSHSVTLSADRWPDNVRLSDIEGQFVADAVLSAINGTLRIISYYTTPTRDCSR